MKPYESIILDQDALDAQAAQSSFHKRSHDNQDPPNNCGGENKNKHRKDVGELSSRSSRGNRSLVVIIQDDTPIQKHSNPEWFPKKLGLAKRTEEKYTTSITKHYVARYYKEGIEDRIFERWSKEVHRYHFEALNGIHRINFFKVGMSAVTEGNVFSDLQIKRSDDKEYEFSYADLPRLSVNDVEDMFIRRTVIKNRVEDIQLGVDKLAGTSQPCKQ
ncbi:hypothetical protein Tco_1329586 [Tanacetum coccineum]